MTMLLKNNAVFFHIPKTGGSWIQAVIEKLGLFSATLGHEHADWTHAHWNDRLHHDGKVVRNVLRTQLGLSRAPVLIPPDAFTFCFVRDPLKWYVSYWRFMEGLRWQNWGDADNRYDWHPNAILNGLGDHDFNAFMSNVNKKRPGYVTEMYGWYAHPSINFIGRNESLKSDFQKILERIAPDKTPDEISAALDTERVNESGADVPTPEWDPAVMEETYRLEYASYVRFGYPVPKALSEKFAVEV